MLRESKAFSGFAVPDVAAATATWFTDPASDILSVIQGV